MIRIENLSVYYEKTKQKNNIITDLNLEVGNGEIVAIIGQSGVGKSTILKTIAGIIQTYKGSIFINNQSLNTKKHRIGFIPQNYGLLDWKTVEQNVLLSVRIRDGKKINKDDYIKLMKKLNIYDIRNKYPNQISGGQKQRASIARNFLLKPDVLLMDESFSALDIFTRETVQKLFINIWKETKVTTMLVTHDIWEAIYLSHRILLLPPSGDRDYKVYENPYTFQSYYDDITNKQLEFYHLLKKKVKGE